jgi:hypothetical protein
MPGKRTKASHERKGQKNNPVQTMKGTPSNKNNTQANSTNEASAVANAASNVSSTTSSGSENKGNTTFYERLYEMAKRGRKYLIRQLPLVAPSLVLMLLGFKELPQKIPLLDIAKQHPVGSPIIGGTLVFVFFVGLIISFLPEPNKNNNTPQRSRDWHNRWPMIATALSTTSFLLSSTLLVIVLVRPAWCPRVLCLPPQLIPITSQQGIHDSNLDVYFTAIQTPSYVLSRDPTSYTLKDVPRSDRSESIGTRRIDDKIRSPYRVVMTAHSLQQGRFGMFIEQVALEVRQVRPIPHPLNVWVQGPPLDYHSNLYQVVYKGQTTDAVLPATYVLFPSLHVQLAPGESDTLDLQVDSKVAGDLLFQVHITYRVFNESELHTLTLPNTFEVIFSDASNWHPYQLQTGHFVTSS